MKKITNLNPLFFKASSIMAVVVLLGLAEASFLLRGAGAEAAPPASGSKATRAYDPIVLPISDFSLQAGLIHNSHNAQAEYQLLRRAGYQHKEKITYETMNRLRREQPNNPVALAGYFMALRMAEGDLNSIRYNGAHTVLTMSHWDDDEASALLQKAYRLAPKLWLTYAVDGEDKLYDPGGNKKQALALLRKAERLAPDIPYVHWLLGDAYTLTPISAEKYGLAAKECKQALASGEPISNAAFILFQIYSLWLPNQAEEIKWKRKFFSLVPPDVKLNPAAREWLDRYPG